MTELLGTIVQSTAGKDRNSYYVIVKRQAHPYVEIANGRCYTMKKPKRKNIRHLRITNMVNVEIQKRLQLNEPVSNELLRSALHTAVK